MMKKHSWLLFLLICTGVDATVSPAEKDALLALYNSTGGENWNNNNWSPATDPCDDNWFGVSCGNNNTEVVTLDLSGNNLTGSLPAELGDLTHLLQLRLNSFQGDNQLSGTIPPELGNLTNLVSLELSGNQLSGEIPSEIGNLTGLLTFYLDGNKINGEVPASIINMTSVYPNFDYNALYSNDPAVNSFINSQCFCSWADTQTVAPDNFEITASTGTTVTLGWDAVTYTQTGGYRILQAENPVGPFTQVVELLDKTTSSYQVTGLTQDHTYHFMIETFTAPHANNVNEVVSEADMLVTGCQADRGTYYVSNVATLNHAVNCNNEQQSNAFIEFVDDIVYDQAFFSDANYGQSAVPPVINGVIAIKGNGFTLSRDENLACVDDQVIDSGEFRLLLVGPDGGLYIDDLTIANGCVYGPYGNTTYQSYGGGLHATGRYLQLRSTTFLNNKAVNGGGATLVSGSDNRGERVINSTFDGNIALDQAGGLAVANNSIIGASVTNNTFTNNQAKDGGGLYYFKNGVVLNNTFSGNQASESGGGIKLGLFNILSNNTFYENSASIEGGAISLDWNSSGLIGNNLFLNNGGVNADCAKGEYSAVNGGNNLSNQSSSDCGFTTIASNLTPGSVGPLMDNGCATYSRLFDGSCVLTHALLDGSEAINGSDSAPWSDQRGYTTHQSEQGGVRDIGAYEYHPAGTTPVEDVMFKGTMEGY